MRKLFLFLINNRIINRFWILIGKDNLVKKYQSNWAKLKYDDNKSTQENVGFSHGEETQESINMVHKKVQDTFVELSSGNNVLDIGCGTGLYLSDFSENVELHGSDLSPVLLSKAAEIVPSANLYEGDFLTLNFETKFDFIFSISVIEYVPPSQLKAFASKLYDLLNNNGIIFIQYPHAYEKSHLAFPDLTYVKYSPKKIQEVISSGGFEILDHIHSFDGRDLRGIKMDSKIYDRDMINSFRNGAILIARKSG